MIAVILVLSPRLFLVQGLTGEKPLIEATLRFIRFWLQSIVVHAGGNDGSLPPIVLVGTHKDKVSFAPKAVIPKI
jgi:hypothetical protein